jgi:hypothetical protein
MDERTIMIVLRLIHIVGGAFWVGAVVLVAAFVFPAVRTAGVQGGRVMQEITQRRRLPVYMNVAAALTVLSGLTMYGRMAAATNGAWAETRFGMTIGFGALATILAAVIGGAVVGRAGRKLGKLGESVQAAGGPPSSEQAAQMEMLQARLGRGLRVVAGLLVIAVGLMAVARYL